MKKVSLLCLCGAVLLGFGVTDNVFAQTTVGTIKVPVGATGKSAYQIWQDAGNTGSEADFLASLVGKDGTPGTNGTNGCATTITKSKVGRTTTLTAKDCNNTTVWTETVQDGTDGAAGQDGAPGCADKLDVSAKNAQGCYTITKTPYSLVNGTCTAGTPDSKQVCDGTNGTNGTNCTPSFISSHDATARKTVLTISGCGGTSTVDIPDGEDGTDGRTPISCEAQITMSDKDTSTGCYTISTQKRKANAAGTECVADGDAISKQVCDGATGATGQDGAPGCATTITKSKVGSITTLTAKDCNNQTIWTETVEDGADAPDQCEGLSAADKAIRIVKRTEEYKEPTSNARGYMEITTVNCNDVQTVTHQDDTCGEVRNQSITSTVNCATGDAVMSCKKQNNQDRYYVCEARADSNAGVVPLGASMDADKDQLQTEINKKLSTSEAATTYLNKTDAGNTYLATANLGTALKDTTLKADVASAVAGSGALSGYATNTSVTSAIAGKADASDLNALSDKVDTNTENIGKKLNTADFGTTANTWAGSQTTLAKQADLTNLSGTVSGHTTQIANKLNTADFGTKANSWASTQTTLAKQADLITVEQTANNAQDTADGHASQIAALETTVGVGSGASSRDNILTRLSTAETDVTNLKTSVDGTCGSTGGRSGCTQSLESRVRALEVAVAALQNN